MYNDPKDEIYVIGNIIMEHEEIENMSRETQMQPGRYCFVSMKKVMKYMSEKIRMSPEGRLELIE